MVNEKPRVLIVDDEQVVCGVLRDALTEQGYLCTIALSGNDALSKLVTQDFDVVLLDIRLPGISGIGVLREIRLNHPHTVTIMITAVSDAKTAVEAMKLGASDYIVKPFDPDIVSTSIRRLLEYKECSSESRDEPNTRDLSSWMNAIAYGVEAKLDLLSGYSHGVTQGTIEVARHLGIAEEEIQEWVSAREMRNSERRQTIQSLQEKAEHNPLAQWILGMIQPYGYMPKPSEFWN